MDLSAEDLSIGRHGSQVAPDDDDDDHDDHDDNDKINDTEGVDPERLKAFNVSRASRDVPAGINNMSAVNIKADWMKRLLWAFQPLLPSTIQTGCDRPLCTKQQTNELCNRSSREETKERTLEASEGHFCKICV